MRFLRGGKGILSQDKRKRKERGLRDGEKKFADVEGIEDQLAKNTNHRGR